MFRHHRRLTCALTVLMTMALMPSVANAQAGPDPQEIAMTCIQQVTVLAQNRINRNTEITETCIAQIEELIEAGEVQQAVHVGRHCIRQVRHASRHTKARIQRKCFQCRHVLLALGAPGLAQLVSETCDDRVGAVETSKDVSIAMIRNALPTP